MGRAGLTERSEARQAMMLFEQVNAAFRWGDGECCAPADVVSRDEIRSLLSRPEYERTWFFDVEDWKRFGFSTTWPPEDGLRDSRYQLDRTRADPLRTRLVAMAEHMARWHCWKGEEEEAALCLALVRDVAQDLKLSHLVQAMWLRSRE